jgi:NADPH:quinone reductase-like Zn-dependent oxidoreductase
MKAVVTTGNGGYERLEYREVPMPVLGPGEALLRVLAAGVNNTEINTRLGWYSAQVRGGTNATASDEALASVQKADGGWDAATPFPFIQGTDCCGVVVEVAPDVRAWAGGAASGDAGRTLVGRRALVRPCMRPDGWGSMRNVWMGSDFDGAFAQYVKVSASEVFPVDCDWSDAELGSIPCAWGSAENMVHRARVSAGEHVLVAGASGGVGSAAVQLAKARGARVTAIVAEAKAPQARAIGADATIPRGADPATALGEETVDVVVDNVGGAAHDSVLRTLRRGGRFVSSGAIGGPIVQLDLRTFYLRDLTLIGCTAWDEPVFPRLVSLIESGRIRPVVARTYPLREIARAQQDFLEKRHVGKLVLIPEHD